ncbi:MAG: hypothetical protein BWK79_15030 [Beggiatoa sp. IS2]|nr:MAG: hypothetical protein BWK79_15030 [Beggiatoa sp. IS2]
MQAYLNVFDAKTAHILFQTYPELLNEEINPLFEASIAAVQKQGNSEMFNFLKERLRMLKYLRQEAHRSS